MLSCKELTLCRPVDSRLEHVDFDSLLECLSVAKLLQVFASLLLERRVIFVADKLRYDVVPRISQQDPSDIDGYNAFVRLQCYVKLAAVPVKAEHLFQQLTALGHTGCNTDFCPTLVWPLFTQSSHTYDWYVYNLSAELYYCTNVFL